MNLQEIKAAVNSGKTVCWNTGEYEVRKWESKTTLAEHWTIVCTSNNHAIGLTWADGVTLNGNEKDFFINELK
ncbi:MAG TPA: hypothetical protein VIQ51_18450 [Chryseosolibacter sp.]|jgi:hypothetical protein